MEKPKANPRKFDVKEYSEKVKQTLEKLKKTQQPGQIAGKGSKSEVLETAKADILALTKEGYTAKQIAEALSNDVFGILPKTITQMIRPQVAAKKSKKQTPPAPPAPENKNKMLLMEPKKTDRKPQTNITDVE